MPGQRRERRADDPDHPDDAVDVDPAGRGEGRVVRHRPGRLAGAGVEQRQGEGHEHDDREAHAEDVRRRDAHRPEDEPGLAAEVAVEPGLAAEQVEEAVAQEEAEPDREDHRGDEADLLAPQRRARCTSPGTSRRRRPGRWSAGRPRAAAGPTSTCSAQATSAPKVTSSPWAKLVSPVVPNTSDRPIAARARMRPKRRPDTAYCGARRHGMSARKPGVGTSIAPPPSPPRPGRQAERDGARGAGLHAGGERVLGDAVVGQLVRQRLQVQLDLVGARAGHGERHRAVGVGLALADRPRPPG